MKIRPYQPADDPVLRELYDKGDYGFPYPDNLQDYLVVADSFDCPLMAAGEKLIPEITLICAPGGSVHPLVKLKGIALLHEALRDKLIAKGFAEALCSVPPELEKNYARHLQRHFGWKRSWETFRISDWKKV